MSLRGLVPVMLAVVCAIGLAPTTRSAPARPWQPPTRPAPGTPAPSPAARKPTRYIGDEPDTGQFLPDSVVLARVNDRVIRAGDYVESFFNSYAEFRPRPDSAGRLEFLNSLINKEVLGLTALSIPRSMGFEDRVVMREHSQRVLSNVLFQRAVTDSVSVTEDEVRNVYQQYAYRQRMRHILLRDRATAERVRADLLAKRIAFKDAVRKYSIAADKEHDGDMGWSTRVSLDPVRAEQVYALEPGQISAVVADPEGYHVFQSIERQTMEQPAFEAMRVSVRDQIRDYKISERSGRFQEQLASEIGLVCDSANVAWACAQFAPTLGGSASGQGASLNISTVVPDFAPADTSRVLARHRFGQFSLGQFMGEYTAIQPLVRPSVNDFELFRGQVIAIVLQPWFAELSLKRGLDRDPMAMKMIESRREELLVEHMYQDSVLSRIWIRPEDRKKYYQDHLPGYVTFDQVGYAAFVSNSRAGADSLAARLRGGEQAEDILRADSLMGVNSGSIQQRSSADHGTPYYKVLFEEMRPGQVMVEGPDPHGDHLVLQVRTHEPGRQLSFEEASSMVDDALQNIRSEEMLKAMLVRLKKRFRIEAHPELLGRVLMVDPTLLHD